MRPLYETEGDLSKEKAVVRIIESRWKVKAVKLNIKWNLDYLLLRDGNKAAAVCEIKCRTNQMKQYADYMISLDKLRAAWEFECLCDIPFFLVVQWTDNLGFWRMPGNYIAQAGVGGRKDRGDSQDIEPCAFIPVSDFKVIDQ